MSFFVEDRDPVRDLGGLCECNLFDEWDARRIVDYHVHEHFELLYILDGCFEMSAENQTYRLEKGSISLVHPMVPHDNRSCGRGKNSYMVLKFTPNALYSVSQPQFELKYIAPYLRFSERRVCVHTAEQLAGSCLDELMRVIYQERQAEEYGYEMALRAYVCQVLLWFIREWHQTHPAQDMDDRTLTRLQSALACIDSRLDGELRAQDVADDLGMGLSTFSRFFTGATGMTFPAYVRSQRLLRASRLLSDTDKPISDVAVETGFKTASYLILCFRSQYGITPSQFRRLYSSDSE